MTLHQLLKEHENEIIANASMALNCTPLRSYQKAGSIQNEMYLKNLFSVVMISIKKNTLTEIIKYAKQIAGERFNSGFEIHEVQTAFSVLEEAIWQKIIQNLPAADITEALRLITTVLGAGKESLANSYVIFAGRVKASSMNQSVLFEGTDGV